VPLWLFFPVYPGWVLNRKAILSGLSGLGIKQELSAFSDFLEDSFKAE
jgi:hypothetical protein